MSRLDFIPGWGLGREDINISDLIKRLQKDDVQEVIVATNITAEGEATAMYYYRV